MTLKKAAVMFRDMEAGNVIEYIEDQKVICGVVLEARDKRLRILNENGREIKMNTSRLSHQGNERVKLSMNREGLLRELRETAAVRHALQKDVDVASLWEVLNT